MKSLQEWWFHRAAQLFLYKAKADVSGHISLVWKEHLPDKDQISESFCNLCHRILQTADLSLLELALI